MVKADYEEFGKQTETIYRAPDAISNLYQTKKRTDRKYDKGGRLIEDLNYYYYYDVEGNLCFKEFKEQRGFNSIGKEAIEKKYKIKFRGRATGWLYDWSANGMLRKVVNPQQGKIRFGYDALGRRTYKETRHKRTCWLWNGNVPLHEWETQSTESLINVVTWIFEGGFVPCAKVTADASYSIVADYLGTPTNSFNNIGEQVWEHELNIYGSTQLEKGITNFVPFMYQGQYFDTDTGLYYNRFRYYDPQVGNYISQDPIRLQGKELNLYTYVSNSNLWLDLWGLYSDLKHTGDGHHLFPRSIGTNLGIRDQIEGISWYPNDPLNTASLHQNLHQRLINEGIPYHGSTYTGSLNDALNAMDKAYKDIETKGFLMIDGKRYDSLTPSEAMKKVRKHIENKNSNTKITELSH